jgi:hypothetical protein
MLHIASLVSDHTSQISHSVSTITTVSLATFIKALSSAYAVVLIFYAQMFICPEHVPHREQTTH